MFLHLHLQVAGNTYVALNRNWYIIHGNLRRTPVKVPELVVP